MRALRRNREFGVTEEPNPRSAGLDRRSALAIVRLMNREDRQVPRAVGRCLPAVAEAAERIARALRSGGRLLYFGAGTSGRLGVLDAAECPPTYGTDPAMVQAALAGGMAALVRAGEGAEDSVRGGRDAARTLDVTSRDVVVGIAASGRTPFVGGALDEAGRRGAWRVLVTCVEAPVLGPRADLVIAPVVGPEIVTGSTRLKAGTATKMVLNMLTTAAMIRLGKVYDNLMVDVRPACGKLQRRALGIVGRLAGVGPAQAGRLLRSAGADVKAAVVMGRLGVQAPQARALLAAAGGHLRPVLEGKKGRAR